MVCRLVSLLHPSSKEAISHYLVGEITGLGKELSYCPITGLGNDSYFYERMFVLKDMFYATQLYCQYL